MDLIQFKPIAILIANYRKFALISMTTCVSLLIASKLFNIVTTQADLTIDNKVTSAPEKQKIQFTTTDFPPIFGILSATINKSIPKTTLKFVLKGVLRNELAQLSSAIIQAQTGQDKLYKIGDNLPGGSQLKAVYSGYVIINHHGKDQKLAFPEQKKTLLLSSNSNDNSQKKHASSNSEKVSNLKQLELLREKLNHGKQN